MYLSTLKFDCEDATFWNFAHAPLSLTTCLVHIPCCIHSAGLDMAQELCQTSTGQTHSGLLFVGLRKRAMTAMEGQWSALSATFFLSSIIVKSWARSTDNSIWTDYWSLWVMNYYWWLVPESTWHLWYKSWVCTERSDNPRITRDTSIIPGLYQYFNPRIIAAL